MVSLKKSILNETIFKQPDPGREFSLTINWLRMTIVTVLLQPVVTE